MCGRNIGEVRAKYTGRRHTLENKLREGMKIHANSPNLCIECLKFMRIYFRVETDPDFDVEGYKLMLSGLKIWEPIPSIAKLLQPETKEGTKKDTVKAKLVKVMNRRRAFTNEELAGMIGEKIGPIGKALREMEEDGLVKIEVRDRRMRSKIQNNWDLKL